MWLLRRRRTLGQGLAEVATVCGIMSSLAGGGMGAAWQAMGTARQAEMRSNLKQVYMALTMFADDNDGRLPRADMYPDLRRDPQAALRSPRSIRRILSGYAAENRLWVNPVAPEVFQKAGLTYVWNTQLNGKTLENLPGRTWVLMDMNAAAYAIPNMIPRSQNGYLVLWSDGSVKMEMAPPAVLTDAEAAQLPAAVPPPTGPGGGPPGAPGNEGGASGAPGAPGAPGGPGGPGGPGAVVVPPTKVIPKDPEAARRAKEEQARRDNPDEDDAVDE